VKKKAIGMWQSKRLVDTTSVLDIRLRLAKQVGVYMILQLFGIKE